MLCTLKKMRIDHHHYGAYDHKLQIRLQKILTEVSSENMDLAPWGIDGCGIPTYAMSLRGMAKAMSSLMSEKSLSAERKEACRLIREAVLAQPFFVGGTGDFCSESMALAQGRLLMKPGAEGVYAGVLLTEGLTFAMEVRDGNPRAARVGAAALLKTFKGLAENEFLQLSSHTEPLVKNWSGETVGKIFVPHPLIS
jgi:L-asparaginase II